jgi:hypothetical protein
MVPVRFARGSLVTPSARDIADVGAKIAAARGAPAARAAGSTGAAAATSAPVGAADTAGAVTEYDLVVWAEVADVPAEVPGIARPYQENGATWWIESARPGPRWWEGVLARVAIGV